MKLANIVYEKELVNHTELSYINYYKGLTEYDNLDKTLPTLYVGWVFMKASNPNNEIIQHADVLKKKIITNELYWECSFDESKSSHVNGVENFINLVPHFYFTPKYTYINLDPVFFQLKDVQDLFDVIPKKIDVLYQFKDEMIYLLIENRIIGLNLLMYSFFKFNIDTIKGFLLERSTKNVIDLNGEIYQQQYKTFPNFTQLKRYLITTLK